MKTYDFGEYQRHDCFSLQDITVERALHMRTQGMDTKHVNALKNRLGIDQRIIEPLTVMKVQGLYLLIDGFHRLAAVEKYNKQRKTRQIITEAPVRLYEGSYDAARALAAVMTNTGALKLPEKHNDEVAWFALRDPESDILRNKTSRRSAAAQLGISPALVQKMLNVIAEKYGDGDIEAGVTRIHATQPYLTWAVARKPTAAKRVKVSGMKKAKEAGIRAADKRVKELNKDTKHKHFHRARLQIQQVVAESKRTLELLDEDSGLEEPAAVRADVPYWDRYS